MDRKDEALAIMGAAISIAGLLLVFAGFLLTKAESYETKRGDVYRNFAKLSLVPVLAALACTWVAIGAAQGGMWQQDYMYLCLKIVVALSAIYAIIGLLQA
jgi:hypothetical protein